MSLQQMTYPAARRARILLRPCPTLIDLPFQGMRPLNRYEPRLRRLSPVQQFPDRRRRVRSPSEAGKTYPSHDYLRRTGSFRLPAKERKRPDRPSRAFEQWACEVVPPCGIQTGESASTAAGPLHEPISAQPNADG